MECWSGGDAGQLLRSGSPLDDMLTIHKLYHLLTADESIPDVQKNKIVMIFSEIDKRLLDGADEHLSILDLAMRISAILAGK